MNVRFVLLSEGSSERPLIGPLQNLFVTLGAASAEGSAPDLGRLPRPPGRTVGEEARFVVEHLPEVNVVVVHRDADNVGADVRRAEIERSTVGLPVHVVPMVPVTMLEAWLLLEEDELRRVAGRPNGGTPLDLPRASEAERIRDPKARLQAALLGASETTGRRRQRFALEFGRQRAQLVESLDLCGVVAQLSAVVALTNDVREVLRREPR